MEKAILEKLPLNVQSLISQSLQEIVINQRTVKSIEENRQSLIQDGFVVLDDISLRQEKANENITQIQNQAIELSQNILQLKGIKFQESSETSQETLDQKSIYWLYIFVEPQSSDISQIVTSKRFKITYFPNRIVLINPLQVQSSITKNSFKLGIVGEVQFSEIVVSIASYRDPDLPQTLSNLFLNSEFPEKLRVVICNQINEEEDTWNVINEDIGQWKEQIEIMKVDYRQAKGPCYARYLIQQRLKEKMMEMTSIGDSFYLQLDSHMRFSKR